ncbi:hypothetical protein ACQPTN_32445 [Bradyrhizobium sp. 13971]
MPKFEFCLPTVGKVVPAGPEWFHEIKYDGYRLRPRAQWRSRPADHQGRSRLDEALPLDRRVQAEEPPEAVRDRGEAIVRGLDGYSDFNALH